MRNFIFKLFLVLCLFNIGQAKILTGPVIVNSAYASQNKLYIEYTNIQQKEVLNVYFKVFFIDTNHIAVRSSIFKYQSSKRLKYGQTQRASWVDFESTSNTVYYTATPVYVLFVDGTKWIQ